MIEGLHHVQIAARAVYGGIPGLREAAKPAALAGRGGIWFEGGGARFHLGVGRPFAPARNRRPCLLVAESGKARRRRG